MYSKTMQAVLDSNDGVIPNNIDVNNLGDNIKPGTPVVYDNYGKGVATAIVDSVSSSTIWLDNGDWCYVWQAREV